MKIKSLLLLLLMFTGAVSFAAGPPNQFILQVQNAGGAPIITSTSYIRLNCSTNVTCTVSGATVSITASSTAATAFSAITAGTNAGQALLIGAAGSLGTTAGGTIAATSAPWSGLTGFPTACTNQAVTGVGASLSCTTITSAYVDSSIAKTGTDINTSFQVTATHLASPLSVAQGGIGVGTLTGLALGNGTSAFTAAANSNVISLWTGTCSASTFLRGDGACAAPSGAGTVTGATFTGGLISVTGTTTLAFTVAGTSGGIPYFSTTSAWASSGLLPTGDFVLGGGAGGAPTATFSVVPVANGGIGVGTLTGLAKGNGTSAFTAAASADVITLWSGTCSSTTFLRGDGSCQTPAGGGSVTGATFTGGLISVTGTTTLAFTVAGTSGGIPYFSTTSAWASSAVLPAGDFVLGGGAGAAPTASFSVVPVANGGIGVGTLTGVTKGNGTSAFTAAAGSDVIALWTGTCSASTFLRGDGSCQTPSGSGTITSGTTNGFAYYTAATTVNSVTPPTVNGSYLCGYVVSASASVVPTCAFPGIAVDATNPATLLYTDRESYVQWTSGATLTLPAAATNFASNFPFVVGNFSVSTLALTPTTPNNIDGGSAQAASNLLPNFAAFVYQDQTPNWQTVKFPMLAAFPACADSAGNHLNFTTSAGFTCGTSSSGGGGAFSGLGGGTNSSAAMVVGTGASLTFSGSGTINASSVNGNSFPASAGFTSGGVPFFSSTSALGSSALLTANSPMIGGGAGTAPKTVAGLTFDGTSKLTTGVSGTSVGGFCMTNVSTGTVCLAPTTGALGSAVWTFLSGTDTVVGLTSTQTLTNKTLTTAQLGSSIATTQATKDNSTKLATTAYVDAPTQLTTGTSVTLAAPRQYFVCTTTCTVTVPVPAAGDEFCVMNDDNVATVITLAAIGSSARYENTARTAYGTAGTGTFVSGGAVGDKVCILGRDTTHYLTASFNGTWVAN